MPLIPTTVVGSYPQPRWLVDAWRLREYVVPRVRANDIWKVATDDLVDAQNDATLLAIRDMEAAGIDVITDGEIRRESYSNRLLYGLDGVDIDRPGKVAVAPGRDTEVPRIVGRIRRRGPIEVDDLAFLRANTSCGVKITVPGPFTLSQQAKDEWYGDPEALAMDFAVAVNEEVLALQAAGADEIQLDEPWLRHDPEAAKRFAVKAIDRALQGVTVVRTIHLCFGYAFTSTREKPKNYAFLEQLASAAVDQISIEAAQPGLDLRVLDQLRTKTIVLGVLDLARPQAESPHEVAARLRAAFPHVRADHLVAAPDCGMKYLSRELAFAKLRALADGAAIVRRELSGT